MVEQIPHVDNVAHKKQLAESPELPKRHSKRRSKSACPIQATFDLTLNKLLENLKRNGVKDNVIKCLQEFYNYEKSELYSDIVKRLITNKRCQMQAIKEVPES